MSSNGGLPNYPGFERALAKAVEGEISLAVADATILAKEALDKRIPQIVAGIAIEIQKRVRMESFGNELVIHVKLTD